MAAADLDWTALAPAWSPDGRYLVIPGFKAPAAMSVIQAENGRAIKSIEGTSPAWSIDGTKLVFLRAERTSSLLLTDVGLGPIDKAGALPGTELSFGPPRHLVDLGQSSQPPVWSRDGKSVLALARRVVLRGRGPTLQVDLLRVKVDSGWVETVAHLTPDPIEDEKSFRGIALSYDRDVDQETLLRGWTSTCAWATVVDRLVPTEDPGDGRPVQPARLLHPDRLPLVLTGRQDARGPVRGRGQRHDRPLRRRDPEAHAPGPRRPGAAGGGSLCSSRPLRRRLLAV